MDPGNWATDIAGGGRYNYALIWVLLMSNIMAVLLQSLAARLGIVSRRDLAQVSHEEYPPAVNIPLYILAEIAITTFDSLNLDADCQNPHKKLWRLEKIVAQVRLP